jgi:hypothetical protein
MSLITCYVYVDLSSTVGSAMPVMLEKMDGFSHFFTISTAKSIINFIWLLRPLQVVVFNKPIFVISRTNSDGFCDCLIRRGSPLLTTGLYRLSISTEDFFANYGRRHEFPFIPVNTLKS